MHKGINTTMDEGQTMVAHALRGEGFDVSEDGTGRGTPIVPVATTYPINTQIALRHEALGERTGLGIGGPDDPSFTLQAGHSHAVAFDCKGTDVQFETDGSHPPLRSMGHNHSHQNAGGHAAVAIQERAISENADAGPDGKGWRDDGTAYTLEARQVPQAVAFAQNQRDELRTMDVAGALAAEPGTKQQTYLAEPYTIMERGRSGEQSLEYRNDGTANAILTPNGGRAGMGVGAIAHEQWAVRRLTPTECERLQGFPDNYTDIGNGRGGPTPDGPRYKALGNSMAVNVMRWIGRRIEMVEKEAGDQ
jgi:DNA (cytosine-5)-methyltransferase 1